MSKVAPDATSAAEGLDRPKPTWELHFGVDAVERRDGEGLRFSEIVELEDAPGFVVPRCFDAHYDDPKYPALVKLRIQMRKAHPVVQVVLEPRLDRRPGLWDRLGDAPYEHVGEVPELPLPRLARDALALAAMPRERPLVSEMTRHVSVITDVLPVKRAPRISLDERALMRRSYQEARTDPELTTKYAVRERVFQVLHEAFPERWPLGDGRAPDYDRLRPFLAELEREGASLAQKLNQYGFSEPKRAAPKGGS